MPLGDCKILGHSIPTLPYPVKPEAFIDFYISGARYNLMPVLFHANISIPDV